MTRTTEIDPAEYRHVLGHLPTGVTVITAQGERPLGIAIGSFASISLDPPLVGFFVANTSTSWPLMRESGSFCVNVLAEDQEHLCRTFAGKTNDKFGGLGWGPAPSGAPLLDSVLAWIDCDLDQVVTAGDHDLVVGRVRELGVTREGGPLVFYRGGYARLSA